MGLFNYPCPILGKQCSSKISKQSSWCSTHFVTHLVTPVDPGNIKEHYDSAHNFVDILVNVSEMARWVPLLHAHSTTWQSVNTLRPRRNGHHFADDIFKHIFFNENIWILIQISLKSVPRDPINNIPALVQIMAWRRPGDDDYITDAYMSHSASMS